MVKTTTTIAFEAGKEYICLRDFSIDKGSIFKKGRVYDCEVAGKLRAHPGGTDVEVDEEYFELYNPDIIGHLCKRTLTRNGDICFKKGRVYKEVSRGVVMDERGQKQGLGSTRFTAKDEFYNRYFTLEGIIEPEEKPKKKDPRVDLGGRLSGGPNMQQVAREDTIKEGTVDWPVDFGENEKMILTLYQDPSVTFNPQKHYDNSKGSLYKIADDFGLNSYEFDILKRLTRCRKKGQFEEDLQKIKDTVDLYMLEQGERYVQLYNGDTAGSDSTDKE